MPRKPVKEARQQYSVMLRPSLVKEIDAMADNYGLTRSQLMGNLIETAMDDARVMEKVGLFKAVVAGEKVMRKFKEALFSGKVSLTEKGDLELRK